MRLERLPGWVVDNDDSVRAEVAPHVGQSMAARWQATRRCCRAAMRMLAFQPDTRPALAYRDPLPVSTLTALTRLRQVRDD